jgi:hypothetical protein
MSNTLAQAIVKAAKSGPVTLARGRVTTSGRIAVSGGGVAHYWRIGSAPTQNESVAVLRAGTFVLVFTDLVRVDV